MEQRDDDQAGAFASSPARAALRELARVPAQLLRHTAEGLTVAAEALDATEGRIRAIVGERDAEYRLRREAEDARDALQAKWDANQDTAMDGLFSSAEMLDAARAEMARLDGVVVDLNAESDRMGQLLVQCEVQSAALSSELERAHDELRSLHQQYTASRRHVRRLQRQLGEAKKRATSAR